MTSEPIDFWKLTAAGNDFVCFDNRDGQFDDLVSDPQRSGSFARAICRRSHGIGADGIIFARGAHDGEMADIAGNVFESDGSECELCGNGTACLARFAVLSNLVPERPIQILTLAGVIFGRQLDDGYTRVCIPAPGNRKTDLQLEVAGTPLACDFVVTGIPHVVTYVDDLDAVDVPRLGYALRHHKMFQPRGANANFVQVLREGEIAIRTFEFGVEGETLACGTGSSASAILTALRHGWNGDIRTSDRPVKVHSRSGQILRVYFTVEGDDKVTDVCLETPVREVMHGQLSADFAAAAISSNGDP